MPKVALTIVSYSMLAPFHGHHANNAERMKEEEEKGIEVILSYFSFQISQIYYFNSFNVSSNKIVVY